MDQKRKQLFEWRRSCGWFRSAIAGLLSLVWMCLGVGALDVVWAQEPPKDIFLVSYIRSQVTVPSFDTIISVTNVDEGTCPVTIVWKSNENEVLCTTESSIPTNQTHHHCSSQVPETSGTTLMCRAVCDSSASSLEGHAIVQTVGRCGVRIGVDGKVYSATFRRNVDGRITSTENNLGFYNVKVYRFDGINLVD